DQTMIVINSNSDNVEDAKNWLAWLLSEEAQEELQSAMGASSVATEVDPPEEYLEDHPWVEVFQDQADGSVSSSIEGFEAETPEIRTIVLEGLVDILTEDASVEETLRNAQAEAIDVVQ